MSALLWTVDSDGVMFEVSAFCMVGHDSLCQADGCGCDCHDAEPAPLPEEQEPKQ